MGRSRRGPTAPGRGRSGRLVLAAPLLVAALLGPAVLGGCAASPGLRDLVPTTTAPPTTAPRPPLETTSGHVPVVMVTGWDLLCRRNTGFGDWIPALLRAGYLRDEVEVAPLDSCWSNEHRARVLGETVLDVLRRTGQPRVHLVAHSMGAITARWCIAFGDCAGRVAGVTTLSGVNHGTVWAGLCDLQFWSDSCDDLRPDGATIRALDAAGPPEDGIVWQTWGSVCELAVVPWDSMALAGADNRFVTRCVGHTDWLVDAPTIAEVTGRLAATPPVL